MSPQAAIGLRRLRAGDAPAVHTAFLASADMSRQGDVTSLADATQYIARLTDPSSCHEAWAVTADDELVGLVCVTVDEANRSGWFWYWMTYAARGQGWMGRAAATVADWALTHRNLERLELGHRVNNPASRAVARRAGFVKEGTEREKFRFGGERVDADTYGRLRSDPPPVYAAIALAEDGHPHHPAPPAAWVARRDEPVPDDVARLLATVPEWFGLPAANAEYVAAARVKQTWTVRDDDGAVVGVALLERHFPQAAEIHLMVVDRDWQGRGVGSSMVAAMVGQMREEGVKLLVVKTLGPSHPDAGYAMTRRFYQKCGFLALEETDLWGQDAPCLIMAMPL